MKQLKRQLVPYVMVVVVGTLLLLSLAIPQIPLSQAENQVQVENDEFDDNFDGQGDDEVIESTDGQEYDDEQEVNLDERQEYDDKFPAKQLRTLSNNGEGEIEPENDMGNELDDEMDNAEIDDEFYTETEGDQLDLNFGGGFQMGEISRSELEQNYCNQKVAVLAGSFEGRFLKRNCLNPQIIEYSDDPEMFADLQLGRVDYILYNEAFGKEAIYNGASIEIASKPVYVANIAVVANKYNQELLEQVNLVLDELESDGTLAEMENYWINNRSQESESDPEKVVRIAPTGQGEPIHIVHYAFSPPLSFMNSDGKPSGFCPELAVRIANLLGRQLEVDVVDYDAIVTTITSDKADLAVDDIYPLAQRAEFVAFSRPYLPQNSYFFGRVDTSNLSVVEHLQHVIAKNFFEKDRYLLVADGLFTTIIVAVGSFFLASILAILLLIISLRKNRLIDKLIALFECIIDGLPVLIIIFVAYYIILARSGISGIICVIIALGIAYTPSTLASFKAGIDSVGVGQLESARALGFSMLETYKIVVLPLSFRYVFEKYIFSFIDILKETSIVGFVAVVDLTRAIEFIRSQTFDATTPVIFIALVYIILVVVFTKLFKEITIRLVEVKRQVGKREGVCTE